MHFQVSMNIRYEQVVPRAQKGIPLFCIRVSFPDWWCEFVIRCVHSFEDIFRSQETGVQSWLLVKLMRWLNYIIILVSLIVCHYPFCLLLCLFESHLWDIIPITIVPVLGSVEIQARSSWCLVRAAALVPQAVQWDWWQWKGCWTVGSHPASQGTSWSSELCSRSSSSGLHPGKGKYPAAVTSSTTWGEIVKNTSVPSVQELGKCIKNQESLYTFLFFLGHTCKPWPSWLHKQN